MDVTTRTRPRSVLGRLAKVTVLAVTIAVAVPTLASAGATTPSGGTGPATTAPAPIDTPRGLVPRADAAHPRGAAVPSNLANPSCGLCAPPLQFHAGLPVMGGLSATAGEATITPVFWAPSGYSFPISYKLVIDGYLANVAAASGSESNVFGVSEQYYQQADASTPQRHIQYLVHAGAEVDVDDPFPAPDVHGCTAASGYRACVSDAALQAEVHTAAAAHGLVEDDAHLYMVFFPPGVETCENAAPAGSTTPCSINLYCAYHSGFFDVDKIAIYANEPYPDLNGCSDFVNGAQAPNGDAYADTAVSLVSHEANEAITDTFGAWFDGAGFENGDECSYVYGTPLGSTGVPLGPGATGTAYNQTINGAHYYMQDEFSNSDYFADRGDEVSPADPEHVAGCLQRPTAFLTPIVTAITPTAGPQTGGTAVIIVGSHFVVGPTVRFGTTASTAVSVLSDTVLVATTPPHGAGTVDVTVSYPGHTSAVVPGARFTYARAGSQPYVTTAYLDLLGRPPTASRLAHWSSFLDHGNSRATFIGALTGSPEHVAHVITRLYQTILGRSPSASRLAYWRQLVTTGRMTTAQVATTFYASTEYLAHGGGRSTSSWVISLYQRLLYRTPPASSLAYWSERAATLGRARVAWDLYQSGEARRDGVNAIYLDLLHRLPDAKARAAWASAILSGGDDALLRHLTESNEYARLAVTRNP
jgi:hypothetical protein